MYFLTSLNTTPVVICWLLLPVLALTFLVAGYSMIAVGITGYRTNDRSFIHGPPLALDFHFLEHKLFVERKTKKTKKCNRYRRSHSVIGQAHRPISETMSKLLIMPAPSINVLYTEQVQIYNTQDHYYLRELIVQLGRTPSISDTGLLMIGSLQTSASLGPLLKNGAPGGYTELDPPIQRKT
ncbi:hypothetical protein DFS33DRAFT_1277081 [Desarmillaria ectypa]|nr:hypothetical protein DFS33DRAFT_1277081 [Desarmillaria ectypa]